VNRAALRQVVADGPPPGVLAYAGETPVGWCAVAPREAYVHLERSRVLRLGPHDYHALAAVSPDVAREVGRLAAHRGSARRAATGDVWPAITYPWGAHSAAA
jgi:hypothetical protein